MQGDPTTTAADDNADEVESLEQNVYPAPVVQDMFSHAAAGYVRAMLDMKKCITDLANWV